MQNYGIVKTKNYKFLKNAADLKKLKLSGICTIKVKIKVLILLKGIQMTTKKKMATIRGISEAKIDKIKEALLKLTVN